MKTTKQAKPKPTRNAARTEPPTVSGLLETERDAVERGVAMLDNCIAEVERMLASGKYDRDLASHLAWVLDKRSQAMSKLRQWGEKVKVQSSTLTPEQERRAIAKYVQTLPEVALAEFRALIDQRIDDVQIVRV